MNARAFVDSLQDRGATLEVEAGRLRVRPSHILTDADRALWKEHRAAILQVLATLGTTTETAPASTCSTRKRVALPAPTRAQWDAMDSDSYAAAEMLRRRLVSCGATLKASHKAGALRLCIEWESKLPDGVFAQVLAARAELLHMIGPKLHVQEFDAGVAHCTAREEEEE